jgi:LysR family transcriptional regulator, benzoate and cis,cis-muconate-responsive activator of ben and cat genes
MRPDRNFNVPLRTLQLVVLAAQAGGFHKAARKLGVDSSLVIRSIDKLENDLGVKIFERDRNRFEVTSAGRYFVRELQSALDHAERAWDLTKYHAHLEHGPFRLGFSGYVYSRLISALYRLDVLSGIGYRASEQIGQEQSSPVSNAENSDLSIVLESGSTIRLMDDVLHGKLHAAFGVQPILDDDLWVRPIARESFCIGVSKNHRFSKQQSILAKELDGEAVFFVPRAIHPRFYDSAVNYIESTGAKPIFREVMSFTHAVEIVAHNFGVALLPQSASKHSHMGVLFKPVTDKLFWIETALFLRNDQRSARIQDVVPYVLSMIQMKQL